MKRLTPREKAKRGMFLSLRELAVVTGRPRNAVREIAKMPGFPLFHRRVTYADFQAWYRKRLPANRQGN
jgi:hypothetical protein